MTDARSGRGRGSRRSPTELSARAEAERERREAHEAARVALTDLQLRDGRLGSELEAIERDRTRLADERAAAEAEPRPSGGRWPAPVPGRDIDLEAAARRGGTGARRRPRRAGDAALGVDRARARRPPRSDEPRRRARPRRRRPDDAWPRPSGKPTTEQAAAETAAAHRDELTTRSEAARRALEFAIGAERSAQTAIESARAALEAAEAERAAATERLAAASSAAAALRGRVESLGGQLDEDERRPIARAARKAGGRRLDDDLVVDPDLRPAVEAALADRARAYLVSADSVAGLATERGRVVVEERVAASGASQDAATRRWLDAVATAGGGRLADAVRRDPTGGVRRLLERTVWLPDLATCLEVQAAMPAGWTAVPHDGSAVVDDTGIALGAPDGALERRAEHARLSSDLERLESDLGGIA